MVRTKRSLLQKIERGLRKKTKFETEAMLPKQKKIIRKKVPTQKPQQGFFHFD